MQPWKLIGTNRNPIFLDSAIFVSFLGLVVYEIDL